MKSRLILASLLLASVASPALAQTAPAASQLRDTSLTPEQRARDVISKMTLEEKALQLGHNAPALPRLGGSPRLHPNSSISASISACVLAMPGSCGPQARTSPSSASRRGCGPAAAPPSPPPLPIASTTAAATAIAPSVATPTTVATTPPPIFTPAIAAATPGATPARTLRAILSAHLS